MTVEELAQQMEDRFNQMNQRIDTLEANLTKEIVDTRNDLGSAIAKVERRIANVEKKVEILRTDYDKLLTKVLTLDFFTVGSIVAISSNEDLELISKWWDSLDLAAIEPPQRIKPHLESNYELYKNLLSSIPPA